MQMRVRPSASSSPLPSVPARSALRSLSQVYIHLYQPSILPHTTISIQGTHLNAAFSAHTLLPTAFFLSHIPNLALNAGHTNTTHSPTKANRFQSDGGGGLNRASEYVRWCRETRCASSFSFHGRVGNVPGDGFVGCFGLVGCSRCWRREEMVGGGDNELGKGGGVQRRRRQLGRRDVVHDPV